MNILFIKKNLRNIRKEILKMNQWIKRLFLIVSILTISTAVVYAEDSDTIDTTIESGDENNEVSSGEKVKTYHITTILEKGGKITPANPEVEEGKNQRFEIIPYEKYKITDVIIDGSNKGSISTYTFKKVTEDHTIKVKFLKVMNAAKEEELKWDNPFSDVNETDWFYDATRYVNKHDLFQGISETEFAPNSPLTRGMLVTVLFRFSNAIQYARSTFDDVPEDAYYSQAVCWASKNGIVNGIGNNQFAPDESITRQDLATIMYRYARFKGKGFAMNNAYLLDYADRDAISEYAYEPVCWCTTTKVMTEKDENQFDPTGLATRAETATIMQRLNEVFNNN